jgi:LysR family transcriptional regulator, cell division regulator
MILYILYNDAYMNINDLNIFATAARLGSITKAAKSLATVQSNVTARIRLLEEELGTQLFHRNHTGITLTQKGQELLPYAQQTIALIQKAKEAVSDNKKVQGILRIGSMHTTAAVRLPKLLKAYVKKYKQVDIAVETGTTIELTEKILNHSVDGAFILGPVQHNELNSIPVFVEELVVVTPMSYRTVEDYLMKDQIPKLLVHRVGCYYRQKLERYLSNEGVDQLRELEFGTLDGIIGCVSAGLGITMLPRSVVERSEYGRQVRVHALSKEYSRAETLFVTHKALIRSAAMERLIDVMTARRGGD